jgi:hypothetical protein
MRQLFQRDIHIEPRHSFARPVKPIARPPICLGPINQVRPNRIEMDVSQQRNEIPLILNDESLVPALEKVPHPLVAEVEPLRVEGLQRQHGVRQSYRAALQCEVDVVVHQTVAKNSKPKL